MRALVCRNFLRSPSQDLKLEKIYYHTFFFEMFAHFSFTAAASKEYVDLSKKRKLGIIFTSPKKYILNYYIQYMTENIVTI